MRTTYISALTVLNIPLLMAAEPLHLDQSYWNDPAFKQAFQSSYAADLRVEPTVNAEERALLVLVSQRMEKGEKQQAKKLLEQSKLTNQSAALLFNLGNIYVELGDTEKAQRHYGKAIQLYPSFRRAHKNLGLSYVRENTYAKAQPSLAKAMTLGDMSGSTLGLLGYCHLQAKNYASALDAYRLARLSEPDVVEWKAGVAQCLLELGEHAQAMSMAQEVVEMKPEVTSYQLLLAQVYLAAGEETKAAATLEWLGRKGELAFAEQGLLAELYLKNGQCKLAEGWLRGMKEKVSVDGFSVYLSAVRSVVAMQQWDLAKELLDVRVADADLPKELLVRRDKLQALLSYGLEEKDAEKLLVAAVKQSPLDGELLLTLARCLAGREAYTEAHFYFERAVAQESVKYQSLLAQAEVFVAQKKFQDARDRVKLAYGMQPSDALEKYLKELERVLDAF